MLRGLIHYWRTNLAVVLGAAVATAVLTGALVVGDSVRESLRALTLERLGSIDFALVGDRLLDERVAEKMSAQRGFDEEFDTAVPALVLSGAAVRPDSGARASRVNVYGVDARFAALFDRGFETIEGVAELDSPRPASQIFPSLLINDALRRELGAELGESLLLTFQGLSEIPEESLLGGERDSGDPVETLRLNLTGVLADRGAGAVSFSPHQGRTLNAFVFLPDLQKALGQRGRVNAVLVSGPEGRPDLLAAHFRQSLELSDLGLRIGRQGAVLTVDSTEYVLRPSVASAVETLARNLDAPTQPVLTYLANEIRSQSSSIPYSTVAGLDPEALANFGALTGPDGGSASPLGADRVLLNTWAAEDLGVATGDQVEMSYFLVGPGDELVTERAAFEVAGIVALEGLGADASLTPEFPGIAEADDMASWDPPFPVELGLMTARDEEYWDLHRSTPKAFIALETGQRLWKSRFGDLTSIRLAAPSGESSEVFESKLEEGLLGTVPFDPLGLTFRPIKGKALEASSGATDFGGLFLGFSLFLIASSALLVALLFSLAVERRSKEIGLRLALGFPLGAVRRNLLAEGTVLAAVGAIAGLGLTVVYAHYLVRGLSRWWAPLLDSPFLSLHVLPASLATGALASMLLVLVAVAGTLRRLRRVPAVTLLAGGLTAEASTPGPRARGRWAGRIAIAAGAASVLLLGIVLFAGAEVSPSLFFGLGAALCTAGLATFALWTGRARGARRPLGGPGVLMTMAARNGSRSPGRSLLSVALVGSACFVLVSVTANRRDLAGTVLEKDSGAGGFALVAESDIPLRQDLGSADAWADLGFDNSDLERLDGTDVFSLRLLPGEDASCLNLYQPEEPRIVGVPDRLIERAGFGFRQAAEEVANPWTLLRQETAADVIPAIGDYNSVKWILHSGLGKDIEMQDGRGRAVKLRIVGLLNTSIFQSELLISEERFLRHFPDHGGFSFFLAQLPGDDGASETRLQEVAETLEAGLGDFGFDTTSSAERLSAFQAVEHAYLSTFEVLGGLGLLLGTLGLGVVLVRNVLERRGELATLRAFGFRRSTLGWMVVAENAFLLVVGIGIGSTAGLIAVAPHLISGGGHVPWPSIAGTLAAVFGVGLLASTAAVAGSVRVPLLPVLKEE